MSISTLDGALAGMQWPRMFAKGVTPTMVAGRAQSMWGLAGIPAAGGFDTTLNGVTLSGSSSQVAGQIHFNDPGAGNAYLARVSAASTAFGVFLLCDRIWHNGGFTITSTGSQGITSPAWPSRDANGSTNGDGVLLGLEVSSATGSGTPTITIGYTAQDGTAGRTGTNIVATTASAVAGAFYQIGLQGSDNGVRSVQSLTLSSSWSSGTINLVAYRILAAVELTTNGASNAVDAITGGFPRMYNGTVPFVLFIPTSSTTATVTGSVVYSHG